VDRVLADREPVAVAQLLLLDRLAVDEGPVCAAQVDDPEVVAPALEPGVVAAGRGVAKDHVVVG